MTEDRDFRADDDGSVESGAPDPVRTGVPRIDAVLEAVEELEGRPVDEHVVVFEHAHEELRRALDASSPDPS